MITLEIAQKITESVSRAPSLHNCQPFRIRFGPNTIEVLEDPSRKLMIADPKSVDHELSLGVFFEALSLALIENALKIESQSWVQKEDIPSGLTQRISLKVSLNQGAHREPLVLQVHRRQSFRGVFEPAQVTFESVQETLSSASGALVIKNDKKIQCNQEYDKASDHLYHLKGYWQELFSWMRFSKSNPRYHSDGLNAESMALSGLEAFFAQFFLHPSVFPILQKLKIAKALTSESAQIQSSLGFCLLVAQPGESRVELGQKFYRAWLKLTEANVFACPMSSLIDTDDGKKFLIQTFHLKSSEEPVALWRFGSISPEKVYLSPRIPKEEFVLKGTLEIR